MRNCSASSSTNSLAHVTRFDGQLPGPKHLHFQTICKFLKKLFKQWAGAFTHFNENAGEEAAEEWKEALS
jgi:hypothetical protein